LFEFKATFKFEATFLLNEHRCWLLVCELEKDPGGCRAAIPKWFFNNETGGCETFNFGGCGGNGNNFETEQECQDMCSNGIGNEKSDVGSMLPQLKQSRIVLK